MNPFRFSRRVALALILIAAFAAPGVTRASGAHLDAEFGLDGIAYLPQQYREPTGLGLLADGRVVVANNDEILALLPSGQIDSSFGQEGVASFMVPPRSEGVYVAAVRVDEEGKPVAVGQAGFKGSKPLAPTLKPYVERLTADGTPDPTFGDAGYVVGGIALPRRERGTPEAAYVDAVGFDSAGRILVSGLADVGQIFTKGGLSRGLEPFLARLEASGTVDRSFSGDGTYLRFPGPWAVAPANRLILEAPGYEALIQLDPHGRPDRQFGKRGYAPYPPGVASATPQVDPRGRTILWRAIERTRTKPAGMVIRRLRPDGSLDRSFGKDGRVRRRIPGLHQAELGFDEDGRILLKASLSEPGEKGRGKELGLIRLRDDGRIERSFGDHGVVHIPFAGQPNIFIGEDGGLVVSGERALVRAVSCSDQEGCRSAVALIDLGSN